MISHLGRKPVKGGNPPRDSRVIKERVMSVGELFQESVRDDMVRLELILRIRNIVRVRVI